MGKDVSNTNCDVGSRIRYYRKLHKMSQEKLALTASMNPAFLGHLERGEKSPTVTTLEKITSALDITLGDLFSDSINPDETDARSVNYNRIRLLLDELSDDDVDAVSDIIMNIVRLKKNP